MIIACWSPKGGSGTSVVAAALALELSHAFTQGALLADLCGDSAAVLGVPDPVGPGISDWLVTPEKSTVALARLVVQISPRLSLLSWGSYAHDRVTSTSPGEKLVSVLSERDVVIDCGVATNSVCEQIIAAADISLVILRPCYLAIKRFMSHPLRADYAAIIKEPNRCLDRRDIEDILGVTIKIEIPYDPAIARAVDAGLLSSRRVPRSLQRGLMNLIDLQAA